MVQTTSGNCPNSICKTSDNCSGSSCSSIPEGRKYTRDQLSDLSAKMKNIQITHVVRCCQLPATSSGSSRDQQKCSESLPYNKTESQSRNSKIDSYIAALESDDNEGI